MSEFVRASWSRRFIAYTIDNIIVEVFWIVLIIGLIALTPLSLNDVIDVIDPGNDIWFGDEVGQILTIESSCGVDDVLFGYATVVPFRFLSMLIHASHLRTLG